MAPGVALGMAVQEGEGGGLLVIGGQFVPPATVDPGGKGPAAVVVVVSGGLKLALAERVFPGGLLDFREFEYDLLMPIGYIGVLAKGLVCGQHIRDDVAAIELLALGTGLDVPIIPGAVVHVWIFDVGKERAPFNAPNAVGQGDVVAADVIARFVNRGFDPHGNIQGLA